MVKVACTVAKGTVQKVIYTPFEEDKVATRAVKLGCTIEIVVAQDRGQTGPKGGTTRAIGHALFPVAVKEVHEGLGGFARGGVGPASVFRRVVAAAAVFVKPRPFVGDGIVGVACAADAGSGSAQLAGAPEVGCVGRFVED